MGYDSCPRIGFDPLKVAAIINLPKGGQLTVSEVVVQDRIA